MAGRAGGGASLSDEAKKSIEMANSML